jgi:hypothetical protein
MGKHVQRESAWEDHIASDFWVSQRYVPAAHLYQVEAYVKVEGPVGIRQLLGWRRHVDVERITREARVEGIFSDRPFTPGQVADGTTGNCCLSLFYSFCIARDLNPMSLYQQATPGFASDLAATFELVRRIADWQGVNYPARWDVRTVRGLLRSLSSLNQHALVMLLLETPPCRAPGIW